MYGFHLNKKGSSLENVSIEKNLEFSLLSRGDGVEIIQQSIEEDKLFYVYPSDNSKSFEFYYLISGEVMCELDGGSQLLGPGDYFSVRGLEEPVHFTAKTNVTLLSVFTEQTFFQFSKEMASLMKIRNQVEEKDRYTHRHSDRVAKYAVKIAKQLKLSKEILENLTVAAVIHDVGKVNVPSEILNKPGRLTDEEFAIIKKHPGDGADMVKGTYYEELSPIIEQHHERMNGSGYPYGLVGEDILIEARIIAVSDTFDAMTKDRSYRKAFAPEEAFAELDRLKGSQYDSEVVEAFEGILKEEGIIQ